jgi:hypothetical protein
VNIFASINEKMLGRNTWPPPGMRERWDEVELFSAFRTSDDTRLRQEASVGWRAPYIHSPLARLISRASANSLFGELPSFAAGDESDQENIDRLVDENELSAELHRGAMISSSEGEVWGRVVVMPALLDVPMIEFVSSSQVIPDFVGRFVRGATFVTTWATSSTERVRLLEYYGPGHVDAQLFRGSTNALGIAVDLASFPPTAGTPERVLTGIDQPLVAFIPNSLDADPSRGFSDYRGIEQRFLALNEAITIGQRNLQLAGRKRAYVDADYLDASGKLPAFEDVFVRHDKDSTMGEAAKPIQMIEYSFEATALIAWVDQLIDSTLSYAGIAPQSVGRSVDGGAISGTALRLKMAHSLMEAAGKGRYWDRGVTRLLRFAAVIDSRRTTEGGFGRSWANADELPSITRGDGLPRDDVEAAQIIQSLVAADAISIEERVKLAHPDWSQDQIDAEVEAIEAGKPAAPSTLEVPRPAITLPNAEPGASAQLAPGEAI